MPVHAIQPGETVAGLAEVHGLFAAAIWDHPRNEQLRAERQRIDALAPGDALFIPEREPRTEQVAIDQRHRFIRKGIPAKIRVQFRELGKPRAHVPYVLEVAGRAIHGSTDGDGVLDEFVPASAREAVLRLGTGDAPPLRLALGGMEPDNTPAGVRKRLANLGIEAPEHATLQSTEWRLALFRFQRLMGLKPTMRFDDPTARALLADHDRVGSSRRTAP